ncbi:sigma-70 family RNA polymerase sigma factor [Paenibacillus sp. GSMTC-2017]|uniref:RNA polymerase sigma factor n=1 Tax=Paenibacillus sp. GSMTC-2017 TaxID=2794350 RepID=UPI0018D7C900|nr:sigma-70 family RNA polymerase sigma factor [Paenibacillus sp. GSMTC-2017]MBH5318432.1 sigma-70 family RNA polymerase sigma factor [Paenibacillus sp. GSMTC-2017]
MEDTLQRTGKEITHIYNSHADTIYKVCFMMLRNVVDAEEATQTVFLKLMKSNQAFRDTEHEKAWLIVTARNHCKNMIKHWWRRLRVTWEESDQKQLSEEIKQDQIIDEVLSLPAKYRLPIYLFYYEGYSTKEIADMLTIKEPTIRTRLHTGRKLLKLSIGGERHE